MVPVVLAVAPLVSNHIGRLNNRMHCDDVVNSTLRQNLIQAAFISGMRTGARQRKHALAAEVRPTGSGHRQSAANQTHSANLYSRAAVTD